MPFRVQIRQSVARKIAGWSLSDSVLVNVYMYLNEVLPTDPSALIRRTGHPFDGMVFEFNFIDPENRLCEHFFVFHVVYSQDD